MGRAHQSFSADSRGFPLFLCSLCFEFTGAFLRNRDNAGVAKNFRKQSVALRLRHEFGAAVKCVVGVIQHAATDSRHLKSIGREG